MENEFKKMNNSEILEAAIKKAWPEARGIEVPSIGLMSFYINGIRHERTVLSLLFSDRKRFAKAFWGEGRSRHYGTLFDEDGMMTGYYEELDWKYNLQQIVLEEDPIKYLEQFLTQ